MPTKKCPKCGEKVSWSKLDKFEDIHICFGKWKDRIKEKPVLNVEEKDVKDTKDEISNIETSFKRDRKVTRPAKDMQD